MRATDIHERLRRAGYTISYPTVTKYILSQKDKASPREMECYIRQVYAQGMECEFDWGELHLTIGGKRIKLYMAVFILAYSNYRMAFLFLRQDTQAFLESHRLCFVIFSGVPRRMVYDNMRVAIASFVGEKQPTDVLLRLERAYGFVHRFCNIRAGNEKGHVERCVEFVRRKAFNEFDTFDSLEEANKWLYNVCMEPNMTASSPATADIVRKSDEDLSAMLPLRDSISSFEMRELTVDKYGTVVLAGVHYSVPDRLVGQRLSVHEYANRMEIFMGRARGASHEKTAVNGWKLDIMHYLTTFGRKPGSVAGSAALAYAAPEIRDVYLDHFADNPSGFISLLKEVEMRGLTLEDLIIAHDMLEQAGVNPSMPGSFEQMLFPEVPASKTETLGVHANEIEQHAMAGLHELTSLMN